MQNNSNIINWAIAYLDSKDSSLDGAPEYVQETPWSKVIRLSTLKGVFYLKQPAPLLGKEADVIQFLAENTDASVPNVMASDHDLHCFLMKDAGIALRKYICEENKADLLCQAIKQFTTFQRSTEALTQPLIKLDIPDWRLEQLPKVYDEIINDKDFLIADGMTKAEIGKLKSLSPLVEEQALALSQYDITETVVQPDFNTNNIIISIDTQQLTIIDLGELAISHPFFSLHNFLYTATIHHGVEEKSSIWHQMLDACMNNWSEIAPKTRLLEAYMLSRRLWPIYYVIANYHFMHCVDLSALNAWYKDKSNRLANTFRQYISENN